MPAAPPSDDRLETLQRRRRPTTGSGRVQRFFVYFYFPFVTVVFNYIFHKLLYKLKILFACVSQCGSFSIIIYGLQYK